MKRGDVPKSIKCYMKETGAQEEGRRSQGVHKVVDWWAWKEMNKVVKETHFPRTFIGVAMNMYQNGDGHGHQDSITIERTSALLFESIALVN